MYSSCTTPTEYPVNDQSVSPILRFRPGKQLKDYLRLDDDLDDLDEVSD